MIVGFLLFLILLAILWPEFLRTMILIGLGVAAIIILGHSGL